MNLSVHWILFLVIVCVHLNLQVIAENVDHSNDSNNSLYPPFTDKEKAAMKKFREIMSPYLYQSYMKTDQYLIRWIRDSNFDLNAAKKKVLKMIEWRKENNMDAILQEDFSAMEKNCPYTIKGHDKAGRPLGTVNLGTCDIRKFVIAGDEDKLYRLMYYILEKAANTVREIYKSGKDVRDGIIIVDTNGFNMRQHGCLRCIPMGFALLNVYESYYPDYLHKFIFINVPRIALPLYDLFLPSLPPRLREIIKIYGYDRREWETDIRKLIDPDQIPFQYGGAKGQ